MTWFECPTWGTTWLSILPSGHVQAVGAAGIQRGENGKLQVILDTHLPQIVKTAIAKALWATGGSAGQVGS
jgi:hypothetical protein